MEVKVSWLVICQIVGFRSLVLGNCQKTVKDTLMGGARGALLVGFSLLVLAGELRVVRWSPASGSMLITLSP